MGRSSAKRALFVSEDLVVEALDVPGPEITTSLASLPKTRRLASGLTDLEGSFRLTFETPQGEPAHRTTDKI